MQAAFHEVAAVALNLGEAAAARAEAVHAALEEDVGLATASPTPKADPALGGGGQPRPPSQRRRLSRGPLPTPKFLMTRDQSC